MRDKYDVRVFLDPPEDLRRRWKVQRDCSRRGYTTDQVLDEIDRREADSEAFIRPQRRHADIVISFMPGDRGDQEHLDAKVAMRPGLIHPELSSVIDGDDGISLLSRRGESSLWVPGTISPDRSAAIEEAVWDRMHFASHLRTERLGEFTVGTQLHRSEPLAITQLLVLYQLVTARAAVAVGAEHARTDRRVADHVRRAGAAAIGRHARGGVLTHEVDEQLDRRRDRDRPPTGARTRDGWAARRSGESRRATRIRAPSPRRPSTTAKRPRPARAAA